ncbi:MAG: TonB family protein [Candidatus Gastranaerophilales bacterium]|nr:TonB family protein [Candidatus Gastranaerophilales bacterium]
MYRCTECHTEYNSCPDYCDCGNDTFEEIAENNYYEEEEQERPVHTPKRKLTPEEKKEIAKEKLEKKKSLIALGVILVLCIAVFILPPHKNPKMEKVKQKVAEAQVKIPGVDSYWNNALPTAFKKKDIYANLPLLNSRLRSISPVLKDYLGEIGQKFDRKWDKTIVKGAGECKVEFIINKEGNLSSSRIITSSNNESLDDSVLLVFSNLNSFDVPPDDYKGERIYITFKVAENGASSIKYPVK